MICVGALAGLGAVTPEGRGPELARLQSVIAPSFCGNTVVT